MTVDLDDLGAVQRHDPGGMLAAVGQLGSHCREGYANGAGRRSLPDLADVRSVVYCGMGGSAVAGDVLRSVFRDRLGVPVEVNRSSELPEHAGPHSLVVACSYSGNTSETLAAFREAMKRGCRSIVITSGGTIADEAVEAGVPVVPVPGGFQPRAALGWLGFTTLGALEAAGLLPPLAADVAETPSSSWARAPRPAARRFPWRTTRRSAWRSTRRAGAGRSGGRRASAPSPRRAGRRSSTRTARSPRGGPRCRSSITTRSWAGPSPSAARTR